MLGVPSECTITYQLQYRRCGKDNCHTCRTGKGHGPYWYAYYKKGRKQHSRYIGKERPEGIVPFAERSRKSRKRP